MLWRLPYSEAGILRKFILEMIDFPFASNHPLHSFTCQRLIKQPWTPLTCCLPTRGRHSSLFSSCSVIGGKDKEAIWKTTIRTTKISKSAQVPDWLLQVSWHRSTRNDDYMAATHPLRPPVQFPWMQGLLRHSFTCEKQLGWWGPSGHIQRKPFTSLMHVAPLRQGLEAHSSMSMLHLCPVEKGGSSCQIQNIQRIDTELRHTVLTPSSAQAPNGTYLRNETPKST